MKKVMAVTAAASIFVLAGCGSSNEDVDKERASATESAEATDEFAAVGDTIDVDCLSGQCLGTLEVQEILVGGNCKVSDELFGGAPVPEGKVLVQISGIQEMTKEPKQNVDDPTMMLLYPDVWDADNFKNMAESLTWCTNPDGHELWGTPSGMGEKMRVYGTFLIPEGSKVLGIDKSRFDLTKLAPTSSSASSPTPSSSTSVAPAVVEEQAEVPAAPTLDPNSADGYGPDQALPPLCERFPGQFYCDGTPIPQDQCIGYGCSPEQDAEIAQMEGDATTNFWACMEAGGTEDACRQ